ncbi:MAG TPA: hypothetical protein VJM51_00900, partial [Dehalococcoidia bacterium]|nr:hypothetical protein [Dehalococcoidia bacterium]
MNLANRLRVLLGGVAFGAGWAVLVAVPLLFQFQPLLALQLRVGDLLFYQEGGLPLGLARAPRDEIVVLHDERTGKEVYQASDVGRDLALYKRLLDQGALAVGDTRF